MDRSPFRASMEGEAAATAEPYIPLPIPSGEVIPSLTLQQHHCNRQQDAVSSSFAQSMGSSPSKQPQRGSAAVTSSAIKSAATHVMVRDSSVVADNVFMGITGGDDDEYREQVAEMNLPWWKLMLVHAHYRARVAHMATRFYRDELRVLERTPEQLSSSAGMNRVEGVVMAQYVSIPPDSLFSVRHPNALIQQSALATKRRIALGAMPPAASTQQKLDQVAIVERHLCKQRRSSLDRNLALKKCDARDILSGVKPLPDPLTGEEDIYTSYLTSSGPDDGVREGQLHSFPSTGASSVAGASSSPNALSAVEVTILRSNGSTRTCCRDGTSFITPASVSRVEGPTAPLFQFPSPPPTPNTRVKGAMKLDARKVVDAGILKIAEEESAKRLKEEESKRSGGSQKQQQHRRKMKVAVEGGKGKTGQHQEYTHAGKCSAAAAASVASDGVPVAATLDTPLKAAVLMISPEEEQKRRMEAALGYINGTENLYGLSYFWSLPLPPSGFIRVAPDPRYAMWPNDQREEEKRTAQARKEMSAAALAQRVNERNKKILHCRKYGLQVNNNMWKDEEDAAAEEEGLKAGLRRLFGGDSDAAQQRGTHPVYDGPQHINVVLTSINSVIAAAAAPQQGSGKASTKEPEDKGLLLGTYRQSLLLIHFKIYCRALHEEERVRVNGWSAHLEGASSGVTPNNKSATSSQRSCQKGTCGTSNRGDYSPRGQRGKLDPIKKDERRRKLGKGEVVRNVPEVPFPVLRVQTDSPPLIKPHSRHTPDLTKVCPARCWEGLSPAPPTDLTHAANHVWRYLHAVSYIARQSVRDVFDLLLQRQASVVVGSVISSSAAAEVDRVGKRVYMEFVLDLLNLFLPTHLGQVHFDIAEEEWSYRGTNENVAFDTFFEKFFSFPFIFLRDMAAVTEDEYVEFWTLVRVCLFETADTAPVLLPYSKMVSEIVKEAAAVNSSTLGRESGGGSDQHDQGDGEGTARKHNTASAGGGGGQVKVRKIVGTCTASALKHMSKTEQRTLAALSQSCGKAQNMISLVIREKHTLAVRKATDVYASAIADNLHKSQESTMLQGRKRTILLSGTEEDDDEREDSSDTSYGFTSNYRRGTMDHRKMKEKYYQNALGREKRDRKHSSEVDSISALGIGRIGGQGGGKRRASLLAPITGLSPSQVHALYTTSFAYRDDFHVYRAVQEVLDTDAMVKQLPESRQYRVAFVRGKKIAAARVAAEKEVRRELDEQAAINHRENAARLSSSAAVRCSTLMGDLAVGLTVEEWNTMQHKMQRLTSIHGVSSTVTRASLSFAEQSPNASVGSRGGSVGSASRCSTPCEKRYGGGGEDKDKEDGASTSSCVSTASGKARTHSRERDSPERKEKCERQCRRAESSSSGSSMPELLRTSVKHGDLKPNTESDNNNKKRRVSREKRDGSLSMSDLLCSPGGGIGADAATATAVVVDLAKDKEKRVHNQENAAKLKNKTKKFLSRTEQMEAAMEMRRTLIAHMEAAREQANLLSSSIRYQNTQRRRQTQLAKALSAIDHTASTWDLHEDVAYTVPPETSDLEDRLIHYLKDFSTEIFNRRISLRERYLVHESFRQQRYRYRMTHRPRRHRRRRSGSDGDEYDSDSDYMDSSSISRNSNSSGDESGGGSRRQRTLDGSPTFIDAPEVTRETRMETLDIGAVEARFAQEGEKTREQLYLEAMQPRTQDLATEVVGGANAPISYTQQYKSTNAGAIAQGDLRQQPVVKYESYAAGFYPIRATAWVEPSYSGVDTAFGIAFNDTISASSHSSEGSLGSAEEQNLGEALFPELNSSKYIWADSALRTGSQRRNLQSNRLDNNSHSSFGGGGNALRGSRGMGQKTWEKQKSCVAPPPSLAATLTRAFDNTNGSSPGTRPSRSTLVSHTTTSGPVSLQGTGTFNSQMLGTFFTSLGATAGSSSRRGANTGAIRIGRSLAGGDKAGVTATVHSPSSSLASPSAPAPAMTAGGHQLAAPPLRPLMHRHLPSSQHSSGYQLQQQQQSSGYSPIAAIDAINDELLATQTRRVLSASTTSSSSPPLPKQGSSPTPLSSLLASSPSLALPPTSPKPKKESGVPMPPPAGGASSSGCRPVHVPASSSSPLLWHQQRHLASRRTPGTNSSSSNNSSNARTPSVPLEQWWRRTQRQDGSPTQGAEGTIAKLVRQHITSKQRSLECASPISLPQPQAMKQLPQYQLEPTRHRTPPQSSRGGGEREQHVLSAAAASSPPPPSPSSSYGVGLQQKQKKEQAYGGGDAQKLPRNVAAAVIASSGAYACHDQDLPIRLAARKRREDAFLRQQRDTTTISAAESVLVHNRRETQRKRERATLDATTMDQLPRLVAKVTPSPAQGMTRPSRGYRIFDIGKHTEVPHVSYIKKR